MSIHADHPTRPLSSRLPQNLSTLLKRHAKRTPHAPALHTKSGSIRYAELLDLSQRVASILRQRGLNKGGRLAILAENTEETVTYFLAAAMVKATVIPINARITQHEIQNALSLIKPTLTLKDGQLLRHSSKVPKGHRHDAVILMTSGTSGSPKGVVHSHKSLMYMGANFAERSKMSRSDVCLGLAPLSHGLGISNLLAALWSGSSIYLIPRFSPQDIIDLIQQGKLSFISAVPTLFQKIVDHARQSSQSLTPNRLKQITAGGAPLDLSLKREIDEAFGVPLGNGYGFTECSPIASSVGQTQCGIDPLTQALDVGYPVAGTQIKIIGPEGFECPEGEVGEIWVKAFHMLRRYDQNPKETARLRRPDGFIATGDLGRIKNKTLYIVGRLKEMIIRSGFNVYPSEVEAILCEHPAVHSAAVVPQSHHHDQTVRAFIRKHPNDPTSESEIIDFTKKFLAPYKIPSSITFRDELPLGPTGKILKRSLIDIAHPS